MIELRARAERTALFPFFPGARDALLLSGLQGHAGRAFLSEDEQSALVQVRGFVFLGGRANGAFLQAAAACFPSGFLTFSGGEGWKSAARALGATIEETRYDMETPEEFDLEKLRALSAPPAGFTLRLADERLYHRCLMASWSEDFVGVFPDYAAFARNGLAVIALWGEEPVAGTGTYAFADGLLEVEIDTRADFQRRGLATACGARFILECLGRGLRPHWDAMNPISVRLAQKLGFGAARPYPVVCRAGE